MRFAYADPPYHKRGKADYGHLHPEAHLFDSKEKHWELQEMLIDQYPDGWAMSCNPRDLHWIIKYPNETRVCAWVKTFAQIRGVSVQYFWEPVLLFRGRYIKARKPMVLDWMSCAANQKRGLKGSKPDKFNKWILELLGYQIGDELVDIFPGTNSMQFAISEYEKEFKDA
jgi:hypothetical protein